MRQRHLVMLTSVWLLLSLACGGGSPTPGRTASQSASGAGAAGAPLTAPTAQVAQAAATSPPAPIVVRASRTQGLGNIMQLAATRGYFREYGIELQVEEFRSSAEALPAISTGDLDVGSTPPLPSLFNALARGVRLALALDGSHLKPGARGYPTITRLSDGQPIVQTLADLRGKRVAHPARGNPAEPALERMLAQAGLSESDLQDIQYMGFPEILTALGTGNVDLAIVPEPWGAIAEERGLAARVWDASEFIPGAQIAMVVFSEKFVQQQQGEAAKRFAVAYVRAARDYADAWELGRDKDAVFAILAESANMDPRILERAGFLAVRRNGRIDGEALARWLDWLADHGYVPQKPDLAALLDHRFADYAVRVLDGSR